MPIQLLYITDRRALAPRPVLEPIFEAIDAGVDLIQIREKDLPTRNLMQLVHAAVQHAQGTQTRVVVNDRMDVALAVGAHGVHLGNESIPASAVRSKDLKDFLVGVSCHSLEDALQAESAGASYLVIGPIFETPSKIRFGPPLGMDVLRQVTQQIKIPVLALGGITIERTKECIEAGATGIAGIRIFQDCESIQKVVRELRTQCAGQD